MRTILYCIVFLFISSSASSQVKLSVTGIKKIDGVLYIGLYNKKKGFTEVDKTYKNWIVDVDKFNLEIILADIDPGKYSISIFHDLNGNGMLDKNFLGMPIEIYGFSNNARKLFSAPSFQDCTFSVQKETKLVINLQ